MFHKLKLPKIHFYSLCLSVGLFALLALIDQVTKIGAHLHLTLGNGKIVIPYLLTIRLVYNEGAAFGMLQGQRVIFIIFTFIAVGFLSYYLTLANYCKKKVLSLAIVFFLAGTIGNAIDRVALGRVVDFVEFPFLDFLNRTHILSNFTCNIADIYLTVGIILLFVWVLFLERKKKTNANVITKNENNNLSQSNPGTN